MIYQHHEITCDSSAHPLPPHRPPSPRRASPCLRSTGTACLRVRSPAWQHHSGYAPHRLVALCTVGIMNCRRLVSREIGVGATPVLTGHAGIAHNHDPLGVDVRVSRGGKARAQDEGSKSKRESSNNGKPERSLSLPAIVVRVTCHVDAWRHALATPQPLHPPPFMASVLPLR